MHAASADVSCAELLIIFVMGAQKYRLYLKRVQGVHPGSRGNSGASPSMHFGHDSGLFSHGLVNSEQVRSTADRRLCSCLCCQTLSDRLCCAQRQVDSCSTCVYAEQLHVSLRQIPMTEMRSVVARLKSSCRSICTAL